MKEVGNMAIKAIVFPNTGVQATYELNGDGSVNLVSVVTKGNYVTNYSGIHFSNLDELQRWIKAKYL